MSGNEIERVMIRKSPLAPLCQRGDYSSLWQREEGGILQIMNKIDPHDFTRRMKSEKNLGGF